MLWGYIVIDTNKILTIKCYLWLSSSSNPCTKIVKEQICFDHTRSKTRVAKYLTKIYSNRMWEITSYTDLSRPWEIISYIWLTFISKIAHDGISKEKKTLIQRKNTINKQQQWLRRRWTTLHRSRCTNA